MKPNYEYPLEYFTKKLHLSNGIFVDIGANDGIHGSMSYQLEKDGWSGILVEPNPLLVEHLKKVRTSPVFQCAISSIEGELPFYMVEGPGNINGLSRFDYSKTFEEHVNSCGGVVKKTIVNVRKISSVMCNANIQENIDLLKIDVEGHEFDVLKSFDFEKYQPALIVTEDNLKDSDKSVRHFLKKKGYVVIARDRINYWFAPKSKIRFFLYDYLHAALRFARWDFKRCIYGLIGKKIQTGNH